LTDRQILHNNFLKFFKYLEEQAELSSNPNSKQFQNLAENLEITSKTLVSYLKSEHNITFLDAFKFCKLYNLNQEEFFKDIPNYLERIALDNDLTIQTDINAVGGYALPREPTSSNVDFTKIEGLKGGSKTINVIGNSMSPEYNQGDVIAVEKINDYKDINDYFIYVLTLDDNSNKIKKIRKVYDDNKSLLGFALMSINQGFGTDFIYLEKVTTIYKILRKVSSGNASQVTKSKRNKDKLKEIIGKRAEIEKVIDLLRELFPEKNDLVIWQSQYNQNLIEYRNGELDILPRNRDNARILSAILAFIDNMKDKDLERIEDDFFE
jgi:hypothetical protein